MGYIIFSLGFTLVHAVSYTVAGLVALQFSKEIYRSRKRKMDYLRDMDSPAESAHVQRWFFPAQLVRGALLSLALYPVLEPISEIGYIPRLLFLFGLMFVYTHLASAAPCPDNIEGFVYLKKKYLDTTLILKFQTEMILYSVVFSAVGSWLLFR